MVSQKSNLSNALIWVLRLAAFSVLMGRAWQHWFWDIPLRSLLWDQALMQSIVESLLSMSWQEYVSSDTVDAAINGVKIAMGFFYAMCAIVAVLVKPTTKTIGKVLPIASFLLLFLSVLYFKEQFWRVGQLIEYTAQWTAPTFLFVAIFYEVNAKRFLLFLKVAIALTFIGHGLYSVGYYPVPGDFVHMLDATLGVSDVTATRILHAAGYLDFVIAVGIFIPRIALPILYYAAFWGLMTALARIFAYFDASFFMETVNQWLYQVVYRLPHFLLPVAAILICRKR